nr:hypothetical protein [Tanacetum cinerariifolium]
IGRAGNVGYMSIWCDIIKEMDRLASHGIVLIRCRVVVLNPNSGSSFGQFRGSDVKSIGG